MIRLVARLRAPSTRPIVQLRGRAFTPQLLPLLVQGDGLSGAGEVTPWPPGAPLDEAALAAELAAHGPIELPEAPGPSSDPGAALAERLTVATAGLSPRLAFAVECALLDALARQAGRPAAALLSHTGALREVACSLLLPDGDGALERARDAAARGITVVKVKIARADRSFLQELQALGALRAVLPDAVRIRLDANGAIPAPLLAERLALLAPLGIELIEEPVSGVALLQLPPLPVPWAPDESLIEPTLAPLLLRARPAAIVLKPAALGLARALRLAREATRAGLPVIVTHAFGGAIELAAARALAAAHDGALLPCGLAPHAGLEPDGPSPARLPAPTHGGLAPEPRP